MSDTDITALVERLRSFRNIAAHPTVREAADALEALQAGNDSLVKTVEITQRSYQEREALWNTMQERFSELVARAEKVEAENEQLREALHKLNIAAAKYRAATDHHLGWTPEHPHLKPLLAAMMDARVLVGDKP